MKIVGFTKRMSNIQAAFAEQRTIKISQATYTSGRLLACRVQHECVQSPGAIPSQRGDRYNPHNPLPATLIVSLSPLSVSSCIRSSTRLSLANSQSRPPSLQSSISIFIPTRDASLTILFPRFLHPFPLHHILPQYARHIFRMGYSSRGFCTRR